MDVVLVTGGNSGIGYEVVRILAQKGMTVYLGSRDAAKGEAAAAELASAGDIRPIRIDMTEIDSFQPALDRIERDHGRLDVLVNNAGIALQGTSPENIERVFQTNLHGPVLFTQMSVPLLRRSANARVVNVSSGSGRFAFLQKNDYLKDVPTHTAYAYCVSKTGLNAATVMFATALEKDGIKVNACNPGLVTTKLSGMKGKTPAEGAAVIVRLATEGPGGPTGGLYEESGPVSW